MATREIKVKKRARGRKDIPLDVVKEDKMPVGLLYAMGTRECTVVKEVDVMKLCYIKKPSETYNRENGGEE